MGLYANYLVMLEQHHILLKLCRLTYLKKKFWAIVDWTVRLLYICRKHYTVLFTRGVPLVKQELLILPEHPSSSPVFSGVRVTRFLVLCVCFVDHCLSFCPLSFGHCFVFFFNLQILITSLWYLQTPLVKIYYL